MLFLCTSIGATGITNEPTVLYDSVDDRFEVEYCTFKEIWDPTLPTDLYGKKTYHVTLSIDGGDSEGYLIITESRREIDDATRMWREKSKSNKEQKNQSGKKYIYFIPREEYTLMEDVD